MLSALARAGPKSFIIHGLLNCCRSFQHDQSRNCRFVFHHRCKNHTCSNPTSRNTCRSFFNRVQAMIRSSMSAVFLETSLRSSIAALYKDKIKYWSIRAVIKSTTIMYSCVVDNPLCTAHSHKRAHPPSEEWHSFLSKPTQEMLLDCPSPQ